MTKLHNDEVRDIKLISSVVATELWGYIQLDLKRKLSRNLNFHLCSTLYANLYRAYGMICMVNVTRFSLLRKDNNYQNNLKTTRINRITRNLPHEKASCHHFFPVSQLQSGFVLRDVFIFVETLLGYLFQKQASMDFNRQCFKPKTYQTLPIVMVGIF